MILKTAQLCYDICPYATYNLSSVECKICSYTIQHCEYCADNGILLECFKCS